MNCLCRRHNDQNSVPKTAGLHQSMQSQKMNNFSQVIDENGSSHSLFVKISAEMCPFMTIVTNSLNVQRLGNFFTQWSSKQDCKQLHRLSERLASLGIMQAKLRGPLGLSVRQYCDGPSVLMRALNWSHMMLRDTCFSDSYRCRFPIPLQSYCGYLLTRQTCFE